MGALDWLWKRAVRGAATALRTDPALQSEVQDAVAKALGLNQGRENQPRGTEETDYQPPSGGSLTSNMAPETSEDGQETVYPGEGSLTSNMDPVEKVLVEAMEDARSKGRFDKAVDLAKQLKRHRAGSLGGRPREFDVKHEEGAKLKDLDWRNLGPHADELAGEVVETFRQFIPGDLLDRYGEAAKNQIAGELRKHPDALGKAVDRLDAGFKRFAGVSISGGGGTGAADPSDPTKYLTEVLGMSKEELEGFST